MSRRFAKRHNTATGEGGPVSGAMCRSCNRFMPLRGTHCPQCGAERPKDHDEAKRILRGELPRVLERLPLEPPNRLQRFRERDG